MAANIFVARKFVKIPLDKLLQVIPVSRTEELVEQEIHNPEIVAQRWCEGRLWLDLRYEDRYTTQAYTSFTGSREFRGASAIWSPRQDSWEVISYPLYRAPRNYERKYNAAISSKALYVSEWNALKKYDLKSRQWQTLGAPLQKPSQIFIVHDRVFVVNDESVVEVIDAGARTEVLASTRRRPAVTMLDSLETLGTVTLFPGPGNAVRASVGTLVSAVGGLNWRNGQVFSWDNGHWEEISALATDMSPQFFESATFLRKTTTNHLFTSKWKQDGKFKTSTDFWLLSHEETNAISFRYDNLLRRPPYWFKLRNTDAEPSAVWSAVGGVELGAAPVQMARSNLVFYVERIGIKQAANGKQQPKRGAYDANLVCFDRAFPDEVVVPLKFAAEPMPWQGAWMDFKPVWMVSAADSLFIGQKNLTGFWMISLPEIESAVASRKEQATNRWAQKKQEVKALAQQRKDFMAQYDQNHNGVLEPQEWAVGIDNPTFLEFELANIDTNRNGFLEAIELGYFDVAENGKLETKS